MPATRTATLVPARRHAGRPSRQAARPSRRAGALPSGATHRDRRRMHSWPRLRQHLERAISLATTGVPHAMASTTGRQSFAVGRRERDRRATVPPRTARSRNGSTVMRSAMPRSTAMRDCSRVNVPPTRISLASARVAAIAWNTFNGTSMRLRAIVLPTWVDSSGRAPARAARQLPDRQRHPASASRPGGRRLRPPRCGPPARPQRHQLTPRRLAHTCHDIGRAKAVQHAPCETAGSATL